MTKITFELDGKQVEASPGETNWQVAKRQGRDTPHPCYPPAPGYRPAGNFRACMVEIEGGRVLAASCVRRPTPGMKVQTASERAATSRKLVFELLVADQPERAAAHDPNSAFWRWADRIAVTQRLQWMQASRLTRIAGWLASVAQRSAAGKRLSVTPVVSAQCQNFESGSCEVSRAGWSATSSSITIFCAETARALSVFTFMPTDGVRLHEAASTRSPSISTMQARQLPSGR